MKTKVMKMLLSACALATSVSALAETNAPDPISEGLARIAEPRVQALAKAAREDKSLDEQLTAFRREAKIIVDDRKLTGAERDKQLAALSRKIEPTVKVLFARAKIDEKLYMEEGERHIKRMAKGRAYESKYLGYLGWFWRFLPKKPKAPIKADVELTLSAPFPFDQRERNGAGETFTDKAAGLYRAVANVVAVGGHDNSAGLAHFHKLTESFRTVQVFAALPETKWNLHVFSDLFAAYGANARSRVEVFANNRVICREEVEHANVFGPVIAIVFRDGLDNIVVNCDVDAPSRNDEIVIRATSVAGAWGGGIGSADSSVEATPRDIRLLLKR